MGKPAPFVEERHTSLSFELPGHLMTQAYSFVAANVAIHEAWIQTSNASCGSDFGNLGWANENGGHSMLRHQLRTEIEHTQHIRKALHMLILSGVVRPSYAKFRYAIPLMNSEDQSGAFQKKLVIAARPSNLLQKFLELITWPPRMRDHSSTIKLRFLQRLSTSTRSSP
jgi:hypothetical protein